MTTFRNSAVPLLALCCVMSSTAAAQGGERRMNDLARRRAESTRVGDYCGLAEEIIAAPTVLQRLADPVAARTHVATICNPEFEELSLLQLTAGAPASIDEVARVRTREFVEVARQITLAMSSFSAMVAQPNVVDALTAALSPPRKAAWIATAEVWEATADANSPNGALGRLSKYERKFGPTAPRLNGAEVIVNFLAQTALPGFRATPYEGPGHWELV